MSTSFARPATLALVALLSSLGFVGASRADDVAPPAETKPPEFPTGPESFSGGATDKADFRSWVTILRTHVERLKTLPPSTPPWTDLRDAWKSILEPRVGHVANRLATWEEPARWVVLTGDEAGDRMVLKPDQWQAFTGDMAQTATELHGALKQYKNVKIDSKVEQTTPPPSLPAPTLYFSTPVMYRSILDRQAAGLLLPGRRVSPSYVRLLTRFQAWWDWSWDQRSKWYKYWERRTSLDALQQELTAELDATRENLTQTLLGLQVLVAAVQNAEEERLQAVCLACASDDKTLREMAETALRDMAAARLEGEKFQGDSYAKYGSIVRTWLRLQKAAVGVLADTEKDLVAGAPVVVKPVPESK
jgi:hypothetical protein